VRVDNPCAIHTSHVENLFGLLVFAFCRPEVLIPTFTESSNYEYEA